MKIILVRHGQAESNAEGIVGGRTDFAITQKGIIQAKKVAKRLKDEKIDAVFCSTLSRARDTLKEILKYHPEVGVVYDDRLEEMAFGIFEGGPLKPFYDSMRSFNGNFEEYKPDKGESFKEVRNRIELVLKEILRHEGKTVLVVVHGRVIRTFLSILLDIPLKEIMKTKFLNTSVTILELKNGKFEKRDYNSVEHLESFN